MVTPGSMLLLCISRDRPAAAALRMQLQCPIGGRGRAQQARHSGKPAMALCSSRVEQQQPLASVHGVHAYMRSGVDKSAVRCYTQRQLDAQATDSRFATRLHGGTYSAAARTFCSSCFNQTRRREPRLPAASRAQHKRLHKRVPQSACHATGTCTTTSGTRRARLEQSRVSGLRTGVMSRESRLQAYPPLSVSPDNIKVSNSQYQLARARAAYVCTSCPQARRPCSFL